MEFTITNKAKLLTVALMGVGVLFTAVGVFMSMGIIISRHVY